MKDRVLGSVAIVCLTAIAVACTGTPVTPDSTDEPAAPLPPAPAPVITIAAPVAVGPTGGTTYFGWPTMTVQNAERQNTSNALVYRFDVSARDDFATVALSMVVPEADGQTSFTPPSNQPAPLEGTLYWRAIAIDQANAVQSAASAPQSFTYLADTPQNRVATQVYGGLWSGVRPTGTRGRARLGPGWQARVLRSFDGVTFQSPPLETLRVYDLLDLGYQPQAAIDWMKSQGYPSVAAWYPGPLAIGFPFQYMALVNGEWELVYRTGG